MSIDNQLLFCYLEEDNIQQAYFRVRPLLTPDADIRQEAMNQFPVEGCLRIVPDRNEQHTFKSRMRDLGHYCLVDLAKLFSVSTDYLLGVERLETVNVTGLNEEDIALLAQLADRLRGNH